MADQGTEIVQATPVEAPALVSSSPMDLLARAVDRGADLAMIEKLMDLAERQERNLAKKAFDAAIAEAKKEIKPIVRKREGNNKKKYADLAAYAEGVDAILAKNGLNYRHRSDQPDDKIWITCVLSHRDGYSEETTLKSAPDTSGNKNSIQAIGSTTTYLQRYTLTLALGLASAEDDDGASADGDEPVSAEQLEEIRSKLATSGADIESFCRYLKVEALPDIRKSQYPAALAAIAQKLKAKKQGGGK